MEPMATWIFAAEAFFALTAALHVGSVILVTARGRFARRPRPVAGDAPGVTILRPVRGVENHIEETLASSFRLSYPNYELIFCCASASDEIVPVVEKLIAAHPNVQARLLIRDDRISVNPKLNNLVKGWAAARHDWIVMADSNILLPIDYLERLLACWRPGTGMVCSPPLGSKPAGPGGELECAFLNTFQARWQIAAACVGLGFAQGKSMLWRRDVLEEAGGIQALAAEAAEDAAATKIIREARLAIRLLPRPIEQPLGYRSLSDVWQRQVRWARLRKVTFRLFFIPELFSGSFFPFLALAVLFATGAWTARLAMLLALGWYLLEAVMALVLRWHLTLLSPLAWLVRDGLIPIVWISAVCGNRFEWRGNRMDIRHTDANGLTPVEDRR
jgi:ceramide glucosyltransferase